MAFVATAAIAMTGCSLENESENAGTVMADAVEFGTYLGRDAQGRAAVTNISLIRTSGWGVFASYTGQENFNAESSTPNFMYNQKISVGNGDIMSYSPLKYWPTTKDDKVTFFAYAPYATGKETDGVLKFSDNTAAGVPQITVTMPTDMGKTVDLVAGVAPNQTTNVTTGSPTVTDNKVTFNLKHEMTRLEFTASVSEEVYKADGTHNKTYVFVRDVKFKNPATDGKFYTSGVYTFPTTVNANGTWSNLSGATTAVDLSQQLNLEVQSIDGVTNYPGSLGKSVRLEGTETVNLCGTTNSGIYLIPVASMTAGAIEADITYDIVTVDAALDGGASVTSATKTVKVPATCALAQGQAYKLNFLIKVNGVELYASIADWNNTTAEAEVDASNTDKSSAEDE